MGFFDKLLDIGKGAFSGFTAGASTGMPHAAGVGAVLGGLGGAFGGGGSGGGGGGGDIQQQQSDMLDKLLGYETPGSRFLENYTMNVFMDAEDDYLDSARSKKTFDVISDAVQSENLDPFTAMNFMASKLSPNSEFYSSSDFASLLDAEVGNKKQNRIVDDAFATNFYRAPTNKEARYYKNLASSMGMNKSPMQFSSFLNSRLANSLEGEAKGPLNNYQRAAEAYYGTAIRDPDGYKTGTYNVFGRPMIRDNSSKLIA